MFKDFNFDEFFFKNRYLILIVLSGLVLIGFGAFFFKNVGGVGQDKIEILEGSTRSQDESLTVVVEIAGEIINPGVYQLPFDSRVNDLLIAAGGFAVNADRVWIEKNLNRAAKLIDGQKVVIPAVGDSTVPLRQGFAGQEEVVNNGLTNINTADLKTLDLLPGIGPVYAQNIVEHRPYSTGEDLLSKDVLPKSTYEKIKDKISVY